MAEQFEGWFILEILGHRRLGGFVREVQIAGAGFLRIDIPSLSGERVATQFYPPASVYALTPTTEEIARRVAAANRPEPVARWELESVNPSEVADRFYDTPQPDWDDDDDIDPDEPPL